MFANIGRRQHQRCRQQLGDPFPTVDPAGRASEWDVSRFRSFTVWTTSLIYETLSCVIVILKACQRELQRLPIEVRGDLADALARLDAGLRLAMPLSRPMPVIGTGVHELRLKD